MLIMIVLLHSVTSLFFCPWGSQSTAELNKNDHRLQLLTSLIELLCITTAIAPSTAFQSPRDAAWLERCQAASPKFLQSQIRSMRPQAAFFLQRGKPQNRRQMHRRRQSSPQPCRPRMAVYEPIDLSRERV